MINQDNNVVRNVPLSRYDQARQAVLSTATWGAVTGAMASSTIASLAITNNKPAAVVSGLTSLFAGRNTVQSGRDAIAILAQPVPAVTHGR